MTVLLFWRSLTLKIRYPGISVEHSLELIVMQRLPDFGKVARVEAMADVLPGWTLGRPDIGAT